MHSVPRQDFFMRAGFAKGRALEANKRALEVTDSAGIVHICPHLAGRQHGFAPSNEPQVFVSFRQQ